MNTTETINGKTVNIDWEFIEIEERHDSNWCEWLVVGTDQDGVKYDGLCQADANNPNDFHADITDIEVAETS